MKNYHYLDIVNHKEISEKIYNFLINNYDLEKFGFWTDIEYPALFEAIPEFKEVLDRFDLDVYKVSIIKTIGTCPVHVDYPTEFSSISEPRMLWPIKNCEGSITNFFHIDSNWIRTQYLENGTPYLGVDHIHPLTPIDSFELNQPAIIDPGQAHNVVCNPTFEDYRFSLTVGSINSMKHFLE